MNRSEFIAANPIESVLTSRGVKMTGAGPARMAICPFHGDKNPSMSVNVEKGIWHCHACDIGGSVIDLIAKFDGVSPVEMLRRMAILPDGATTYESKPKWTIEKIYSYTDALGGEVYQAVRLKPKSFRQRHPDGKGGWTWSMEGVERMLYRLPEILKAQTVWVTEGEKDADNLMELGFVATCNVGGAGKWLDAYTESLAGKDVILCGDNDDPGRKHIEMIFKSLAGKVKTAKIIKIPAPHKDASDFIAATLAAKAELERMAAEAMPFVNGIDLPLFTMQEIEPRYKTHARSLNETTLDLSKWLPSLRFHIRGIVPGEMVLLIGDTGVGKSALLQNLAYHAKPLPTVFFQLELPETLMFERFLAISSRMPCSAVETCYRTTDEIMGEEKLQTVFPHLLICSEPNISPDKLESLIVRSELKFNKKPILVLLDYIQLVSGTGKRYERTSDAAERLKVIAKGTRTIIVVASQVHRPEYSDSPDIGLHSGKDSGSLENSAGLVLGAWRDEKESSLLHLKILKNTKGQAGTIIECNFDGSSLRITERANQIATFNQKPI